MKFFLLSRCFFWKDFFFSSFFFKAFWHRWFLTSINTSLWSKCGVFRRSFTIWQALIKANLIIDMKTSAPARISMFRSSRHFPYLRYTCMRLQGFLRGPFFSFPCFLRRVLTVTFRAMFQIRFVSFVSLSRNEVIIKWLSSLRVQMEENCGFSFFFFREGSKSPSKSFFARLARSVKANWTSSLFKKHARSNVEYQTTGNSSLGESEPSPKQDLESRVHQMIQDWLTWWLMSSLIKLRRSYSWPSGSS